MTESTDIVERLLPCPLCGRVGTVSQRVSGIDVWDVECDPLTDNDGCGLSISRTTREAAIAAWNLRTERDEAVARERACDWEDIGSAPKNETAPILVYFDHDADPYNDPAKPNHLTDYAANAEGGDFLAGKGVAVAIWRDGYHQNDGWEVADKYWMPGGWFAWLNGDATDHVVNALAWRALPAPPIRARRAEDGDG